MVDRTVRGSARSRRSPDVIMLVVGLVSLAMAIFAILGYVPPFPTVDLRWLLSGGVVLVGVVMLATSLRRPRRDDDS